jgi:hypothetical protein
MSESTQQYRILTIVPIASAESVAEWMRVNLGEEFYHEGLGLLKFSPGGVAPATHTWSNGTYTVAEATLLLQYLRGMGSVPLPTGWDEMEKGARLAAADDGEDAALSGSGVLSILVDNAAEFDAWAQLARIDTGGAPLEPYYPEE